MPFSIVADDLTRVDADALVVAANSNLVIDGGVGYAVARAAGMRRMQRACEALAPCPVGEAVVTAGFRLNADHVVHAVAPVWAGGDQGETELLRQAYSSALRAAAAVGARSIALSLLGSGVYGVPAEVSLAASRHAVREFLDSFDDLDVTLVVYSKAAIQAAAIECESVREFMAEVAQREERQLRLCSSDAAAPVAACAAMSSRDASGDESSRPRPRIGLPRFLQGRGSRVGSAQAEEFAAAKESAADAAEVAVAPLPAPAAAAPSAPPSASAAVALSSAPAPSAATAPSAAPFAPFGDEMDLGELLNSLDASFSTTLLALIDARGLTDAQVYKRANMSRQLFSKIRSDAAYQPTKRTALSLAVALELSMQETRDLLARAGFALSRSNRFDVILEYFISRKNYDIFVINETLFQFDQPLLGGRG